MLVKELQALALDIRVLNSKGEEIDLATLGADDDAPAYRRHNPRVDRHIMDEDDTDRAVGQTVATDALSDGYLLEKSEVASTHFWLRRRQKKMRRFSVRGSAMSVQ